MLYHFLYPLRELFSLFNLFKYITIRSAGAALFSFLGIVFTMQCFIALLNRMGLAEKIKFPDAPLLQCMHERKEGTPTMGGLLLVFWILVSSVLWARLDNSLIWISLFVLVFLAFFGFIDDLIKVKTSKKGLRKMHKLIIQFVAGVVIGVFVIKSPLLNESIVVPFFKDVQINAGWLYLVFSVIIITASSNAVNLTDGLDGLACGALLFVCGTFLILSYITGHAIFSKYLFVPFVPGAGELTVLLSSCMGALLGFLWFNCFPAQIFMGDVGALSLGGLLGCISLLIKKELLLFIAGGLFVAETVSVILQIIGVKFFNKRFFKIAPLHHHFQAKGWPEPQIITRLWIICAILALFTLITLKIR